MTQLFNYFTKKSTPVQFAGAPFVLGGALMLLSAVFAYRSLYKEKQIIKAS
jgi:DHA1 family tetracycline resistance protein-like MFS transporter